MCFVVLILFFNNEHRRRIRRSFFGNFLVSSAIGIGFARQLVMMLSFYRLPLPFLSTCTKLLWFEILGEIISILFANTQSNSYPFAVAAENMKRNPTQPTPF